MANNQSRVEEAGNKESDLMAEKIDREEAAQEVLDFMRVSTFNIIFMGDLTKEFGEPKTRVGLAVLLERGVIKRALRQSVEPNFLIVDAEIKE